MWEIIDNDGVIHSGSESEMRLAFTIMTNSEEENEELKDELQESIINDYSTDWNGDLKLIEVHLVTK